MEDIEKILEEEKRLRKEFERVFDRYDILDSLSEEQKNEWNDIKAKSLKKFDKKIDELENQLKNNK